MPFAPGGLTDVPTRLAATLLQEKIGQNFVVENKTGGSGTIGGQYVARAEPDGYTLLANSVADTQNLHYMPVPYSAVDDFAQIGFIVEGPALVVVIDAKLPYKTLDELLAAARDNPSKISFGTSGPASSPGLSLKQLNAMAKTEIVGVPYRGVGEAARAAAAGIIQGTFVFYSQAKPLAEEGKVRALAVASPQRIPTWPEVPTLRELGYNIDGRGFVGLAAPAKTPKPIISYLNTKLNEAVQSDVFKSRMALLGMAPAEATRRKSSTRSCAPRPRSRPSLPSCRARRCSVRVSSDRVGSILAILTVTLRRERAKQSRLEGCDGPEVRADCILRGSLRSHLRMDGSSVQLFDNSATLR